MRLRSRCRGAPAGALALLLLLGGTACQVTLTAAVEAEADGTGRVRAGIGLDDEALRELGDPATELRADDLRQSGWKVTGPAREKDGLTWVRVAKPFSSPEDAALVAAELSGPEGPFRDFRLRRKRTFLRTSTSFTGVVDLSKGLTGLSDPALQTQLGDAPLGLDLDSLRGRFGAELDQRVRVRVEASLPGRDRSWAPRLGEQVRLSASAESLNLRPLLGALGAVVFAAAALALVVAGRGRRR